MSLIPLGILDFPTAAAGSYNLLETEILTGTQASVTFSSLGSYSTYQHLQIRVVARSNRAATTDSIDLKLNGATTNYRYHALRGSGSSVASFSGTPAYIDTSFIPAASDTANSFGPKVIDILDPFETTKTTTTRTLWGMSSNETWIGLFSGGWFDTSAITSIALECNTGSFITGSRFSLYGLKGA
jgi:hypothetical protein